jgi:hypothetical protein
MYAQCGHSDFEILKIREKGIFPPIDLNPHQSAAPRLHSSNSSGKVQLKSCILSCGIAILDHEKGAKKEGFNSEPCPDQMLLRMPYI